MSSDEQPRTVFGAPNQDEIISRLDSVDSDDEGSSFFAGHEEQMSQAHRRFAEGVSTFTGVAQADDVEDPQTRSAAEPPSRGVVSSATPVREGTGTLPLTDPAERAAFILGGPAALRF